MKLIAWRCKQDVWRWKTNYAHEQCSHQIYGGPGDLERLYVQGQLLVLDDGQKPEYYKKYWERLGEFVIKEEPRLETATVK